MAPVTCVTFQKGDGSSPSLHFFFVFFNSNFEFELEGEVAVRLLPPPINWRLLPLISCFEIFHKKLLKRKNL